MIMGKGEGDQYLYYRYLSYLLSCMKESYNQTYLHLIYLNYLIYMVGEEDMIKVVLGMGMISVLRG